MKVLSLVGARPQYIKEAVLNHEFRKQNIKEVLVNSGQHYDFNMADVFFKSLDIKEPDYNLKVGSGKHGEMTGKIMTEFEKVAEEEKPDVILVYGDTNTTLAGAIVAAKLKIKLAHVEAGLRMHPKDMPEEINRVLTDRISNLLFTPSQTGVENLKKEGITEGVYFTGDVTYDLFLKMKSHFNYELLGKYNLKENRYIIVTLHRDFNVDYKEKLKKILTCLEQINKKINLIFPLHPRTKKRITEFGLEKYLRDITVTEPLEYLELMGLVSKSLKVITDSGGLQKESYFAGKPGLILMPDTAWVELVESGCNLLCNEQDLLKNAFTSFGGKMIEGIYGDGTAGEKIVNILSHET
jgi:UDP-N-acetylglucosamine 2-epimerase (non-hydrolysing)